MQQRFRNAAGTLRRILLMASLFAVPLAFSEAEPRVFTERVYQHGDATIALQQTRGQGPPLCKASLVVSTEHHETFRIEYSNIEAVGDSYGIFVPNAQPSDEFFLVFKIGDYEGRMFVIDKQGNTRDLIGGYSFTVALDEVPYLFVTYHSDIPGLLILNLTDGRVVYGSVESPVKYKEIPNAGQWYRLADQVFFTPYLIGARKPKSPEDDVSQIVYTFNFDKRELQPMELSSEAIKAAERIEYEFDPHDYPDCKCTSEDAQTAPK